MIGSSTLVGLSRLKDFSIFENRIGTVVQSYVSNPPAGCLYIGNQGVEVSKTEWSELYAAIGGEDGSDSTKFVLPYKADDGALKHYLVGKVLVSDITQSGNNVVATFTNSDLDANGYYTFRHGIGHINPILQLYDNNNEMISMVEVINSVGQSKIKIAGTYLETITGTWKVIAVG